MPTLIPVAEYLPDQAPYGNPGTALAKNVIPSITSYRPFKSFAAYGASALTARAQGAWFGRAVDGSARVFCGDATKLYALVGQTWNDVSRSSGGAYATGATAQWKFTQFGDSLIAQNGTDDPQVFTLSDTVDGSVKFTALGGSPPVAEFITVVKDFVVCGKVAAANGRVQWSAINNSASWATSATTMADYQDLPEGGSVRGLVGGEFGIILQDDSIRRMRGPTLPEIFVFDRIATGVGNSIQGSLAAFESKVFFCHRTGFQMLVNGQEIVPIGAQKIDRTFWEDVDQNNFGRVTSAIDPINKTYIISYPSNELGGGVPNRLLIYEHEVGRWTFCDPGVHEMIWTGSTQTAITLDDADEYADDVDAVGAPSFDSEVYAGSLVPVLSSFTTSHILSFANGANLEAVVDTAERMIVPNAKAYVRSARPVVDGTSTGITLSLGARDTTTETVTYTSAVTPSTATGLCNFRSKARYHRGRITVAAGETWTHLLGIDDIRAIAAGWR